MGRLCPDLAITFYQGDWMKFYPLQLHGSEPQLEPRMTHAAYKTSLPIGRPTTGVGPSPFHGGRGATSLPRRSNWSAPDNMPDISTGQSWPGGSSGDPNGSWPSPGEGPAGPMVALATPRGALQGTRGIAGAMGGETQQQDPLLLRQEVIMEAEAVAAEEVAMVAVAVEGHLPH